MASVSQSIIDLFVDNLSSSLLKQAYLPAPSLNLENDTFINHIRRGLLDISNHDPLYSIRKLFALLKNVDSNIQNKKIILFLLHLIVDLIHNNFKRLGNIPRHFVPSSVFSRYGTSRLRASLGSVINSNIKVDHLDYYSPDDLSNTTVVEILDEIGSLISNNFPKLEYQNFRISNSNSYSQPLYHYTPDPQNQEIDDLCGEILSFISNTCPIQYHNYLTKKLFTINTDLNYFFKIVQFLQFASLTENNLLAQYFDFVGEFCKASQNDIALQQLLLKNLTRAIRIWISYFPQDFLTKTNLNNPISFILADKSMTIFEHMSHHLTRSSDSINYRFTNKGNFANSLVMLFFLNPTVFNDFSKVLKTQSLDTVQNNSQLSFLNTINNLPPQGSEDPEIVDLADICVLITGLASVMFAFDKSNPIIKFWQGFNENLYKILKFPEINYYNFETVSVEPPTQIAVLDYNVGKLDELRISYFCFLTSIDSSTFTNLFDKILNDNFNKVSLHRILLFVSGLRLYQESSDGEDSTFLSRAVPFLNNRITKFVEIVEKSKIVNSFSSTTTKSSKAIPSNSAESSKVIIRASNSDSSSSTAETSNDNINNSFNRPTSPGISGLRSRTTNKIKSQSPDLKINTILSANTTSSDTGSYSNDDSVTLTSAASNKSIYGETVNLAKSIFKERKLTGHQYHMHRRGGSNEKILPNDSEVEKPSTLNDFQSSSSSSNDFSDVTSVITVMNNDNENMTLYDNLAYQQKLTNPVFVVKRILSNLFAIMKISPLSYISPSQLDISKEFNFDDYPQLIVVMNAVICGLKEDSGTELFQVSKGLFEEIINPNLLTKDFKMPFKSENERIEYLRKIRYGSELSNTLCMFSFNNFVNDHPNFHVIVDICSKLVTVQNEVVKENIDVIVASNVNTGFENPQYLLKQFHRIDQFLIESMTFTDIKLVKLAIQVAKTLEQQYQFFGLHSSKPHLGARFDLWELKGFFFAYLDEFRQNEVSGVMEYRKRLRACVLQNVSGPSPSLTKTWRSLFDRWKELLNFFTFNDIKQLKPYDATANTISSLTGVMLDIDDSYKSEVVEFIESNLNLFQTDNAILHAFVKNFLVDNIHPKSFSLVGLVIKKFLETYDFDNATEASRYSVMDTILSLLKSFYNTKDRLYLFDQSVLISEFSLILIKMTNKFNWIGSYQMKIKTASVYADYNITEILDMEGSVQTRNYYLQVLIGWLYDSIKSNDGFNGKDLSIIEDLKEKLCFQVARSINLITNNLKLCPIKTLHHDELLKENQSTIEKYFNAILLALEKYGGIKGKKLKTNSRIRSIIDNLIIGLGNLFASNIDNALDRSILLGYQKDKQIQLVFFKIFTILFKNGIVTNYSKIKQQQENNQNDFINFLVDNLDIVVAFVENCPSNEIDLMAYSLLSAFQSRGKHLDIIEKLIKYEVLTVNQASTVLRQNTVTSRLLYSYAKVEGKSYLVDIVAPVLNEVLEKKEYFSEGNPKDLECFEKHLEKLVNVICDSTDKFPISFKYICYQIRKNYTETFNKSDYLNVVGAFVFLKFICPSIVNNDSFVNNEQFFLNEEITNSFLLLARYLQGLSNKSIHNNLANSYLRWKEAEENLYYDDQNPIILRKLGGKIQKFLNEVSRPLNKPNCNIIEINSNDILYLNKFTYENILKVRKSIIDPKFPNDLTKEEKYSKYQKLDQVLSVLKTPTLTRQYVIPKRIKEEFPKIYEFMQKIQMIGFSSNLSFPFVKQIKFEGVPTIVFSYYQYHQFKMKSIYGIYIFLQFVTDLLRKPFYFVLDCTDFGDSPNLFTNHFIIELLNEDFFKYLKGIFVINPNCAYLKALETSANKNNDLPIGDIYELSVRKIRFISTFDNPEYLEIFNLCERTTKITYEKKITFQVQINDENQNLLDSKLSIAGENIHIHLKKLFFGRFVNLVETLKLQNYQLIFPSNNNEINLINDNNGNNYKIITKCVLQISEVFHVSKNKVLSKKWDLKIEDDQNGNDDNNDSDGIKTYLGDILNLSFSGVLSIDKDIRTQSSYLLHLLVRKTDYFKIDSTSIFFNPEKEIPEECVWHVQRISREIAKQNPDFTLSMIKGFFRVYDTSKKSDKKNLLVYIVPFLENIYEYIHCSESSTGVEDTINIVRELVKYSNDETTFFMFKTIVWNVLCYQDELTKIIVEQILEYVLETYFNNVELKENLIKNWSKFITMITESSTLTICSEIVNKLIKMGKSYKSGIVTTEKTLNEMEILMKMCVYSFFNSKHQYSKFFPELLFISTIYSGLGSKEFRNDTFNLANSLFYVFKYDDEGILLKETTSVDEILDYLDGDTAKLIYGLNVESNNGSYKNFLQRRNEIFGDISRYTSLCTKFVKFINTFENKNLSKRWKVTLIHYVYDLLLKGTGSLHNRAVIIFGILASKKLNYRVFMEFIDNCLSCNYYEYQNKLMYSKNSISSLYALSYCLEGLEPFNGLLCFNYLWIELTLLLSNDLVVNEMAVKVLIKIGKFLLKKFNEKKFIEPEIGDLGFDSRKPCEGSLIRFEKQMGFSIDIKNCEIYITFMFLKNSQIPYLKLQIIELTKIFIKLKIFMRNEKGKEFKFNSFLILLYLLIEQDEFFEFLKENSIFDEENVELNSDIKIPKYLIKYLLNDDEIILTLLIVLITYYQSSTIEIKEKIKLLVLLRFISEKNPQSLLKLRSELSDLLEVTRNQANDSLIALTIAIDIFKIIINIKEDYEFNYSEEILKKSKMSGIKNFKFYKLEKTDLSNQEFLLLFNSINEMGLASANYFGKN